MRTVSPALFINPISHKVLFLPGRFEYKKIPWHYCTIFPIFSLSPLCSDTDLTHPIGYLICCACVFFSSFLFFSPPSPQSPGDIGYMRAAPCYGARFHQGIKMIYHAPGARCHLLALISPGETGFITPPLWPCAGASTCTCNVSSRDVSDYCFGRTVLHAGPRTCTRAPVCPSVRGCLHHVCVCVCLNACACECVCV